MKLWNLKSLYPVYHVGTHIRTHSHEHRLRRSIHSHGTEQTRHSRKCVETQKTRHSTHITNNLSLFLSIVDDEQVCVFRCLCRNGGANTTTTTTTTVNDDIVDCYCCFYDCCRCRCRRICFVVADFVGATVIVVVPLSLLLYEARLFFKSNSVDGASFVLFVLFTLAELSKFLFSFLSWIEVDWWEM